jgi:tetratricopeptide (TPR) repeat protein
MRNIATSFWLIAIFMASHVCMGAAPSAEVSTAFEDANKLYGQGRYAEAAVAYESLASNDVNAVTLYFNLGNALFKSGQLGRAIAAYRKGEKLSPRDPELRANLQFARDQVKGATFRAGWWERMLNKLRPNEWTAATVAGLWATFLMLAAMQIWPNSKSALRTWTSLSTVMTLLLGGTLGCAMAHEKSSKVAVVTANEITVHTGPFPEAQSSFTAHDGAELRVLDRKDDWLQVTDGTRRFGWVKKHLVMSDT